MVEIRRGKWKAGKELVARKMNVTLDYLFKMNFTNPNFINDATGMQQNEFYIDILCAFNNSKTIRKVENMNPSDIINEPLWGNKMFMYRGKALFFKQWIKDGILYVKDIVSDEKVMEDSEIFSMITCKNRIIQEAFMAKNSPLKKMINMDFSIKPYVKITDFKSVLIGNARLSLCTLRSRIFYEVLIAKEQLGRNKMESVYNEEFDILNKMVTWRCIYRQ